MKALVLLLVSVFLLSACSDDENKTGEVARKADTNLLGFYTTAEVHKGLALYKAGDKASACQLLLPNQAKDELILVEEGTVPGSYSVSSCLWPTDKNQAELDEGTRRVKGLSYSCYFHGEILGEIFYVKVKDKKHEWPAQINARDLLLQLPTSDKKEVLEKVKYQKMSDTDADAVADKIMINGCQST